MFKQRQAYSAIPPTAFSVSQTAVDKWDKSEDDGAGCLHLPTKNGPTPFRELKV